MNEETIFAAALEMPPAERSAYLAKACADDSAMRKRLEGLLAASERAGKFMARPAVDNDMHGSATEIVDGDRTPTDSTITRAGGHPEVDEDMSDLAFLTPSSRPDSLGRIGHYEVLQVLGKGGFGIVFRAFDDVLQRVVAVKVMAPQLAATSPARKRFLREARSSAQVRHENVVQVYEIGEQPLPYLAMEFIPGETLQQRLDRTGPLEVMEVVRIGRQIAEGLAAAHSTDLVHRDIKPSNILIEGGHEKAKLTDFGLARAADDASISQSGIIAGTPMYMAPEQAKGDKLDQRADLFSFGSVLYQMASGRPPFRANGTVAVLKRVAEDKPRDIREIIPETPQWLCNTISKLHEKKPEDRFQSAREIADVLADCEQQLKAHGAIRDFSRIPGGKPRPSRRRKRAVAAVVLLLAVSASVYAGPYTLRYAFDSGKVTFTNDDDSPGDKLLVRRDGQLVATLDADNPSVHLAAGEYELEGVCAEGYEPSYYVAGTRWLFGGPNHGQGSNGPVFKLTVERGDRIRVGVGVRERVVPSPDSEGWVQLFNGKNLSGWKTHPAEPNRSWQVEDGSIVLKGSLRGHLFSEREDFADVHVRVEAMCEDNGTAVGVRAPFNFDDNGGVRSYGALIGTRAAFGPFTFTAASNELLVKPGHWFTQELILRGDKLVVKLNDNIVSEVTAPVQELRGRLVISTPPGGARFRKIEIKELPSDSPPPAVELSNWGKFVDPRGECKQTRSGQTVSMKVPGTRPYNLVPTPGFNLDAPRLVQELEGDFLIQTTVKPYELPKPNTSSRPERRVSFRAAGLLVWVNEQTFLRFERASYGESGEGTPYLNMEWYNTGQPGRTGDAARPLIPDDPTHLQIERRGPVLYLRRSDDGRTWTDVNAVHNMNLPQRVSVGLVACNSTNTEFTAAFDDLRLRGASDEPGWVRLFNGKDLKGWKTHPTEPGDWKVEDGMLVGKSGRLGYLFSERDDFQNFHLRAEVKLNAGGDSGVFVRAQSNSFVEGKKPQYLGKKSPPGYEAQICNDASSLKTGSLFLVQEGVEPALTREDRQLVQPDQWFILEIIADGPWLTVKINGERTANLKNDVYTRGHLALQMWHDKTTVHFKKIEIKELPLSSPPVPKTVADVLPFFAGNWKMERQTVDPMVPSEKGIATHAFVAGGRFLRGHCSINEGRLDGATNEVLDFWSFEPGQNSLRRWFARSDGHTAFISGRFHPANRTLITTLRVGADDRVQQYEFVDPDTFNFQVFQKDASGMLTGGFHHKCIRVNEPVAVPRLPLDPKRPEEMKVLDRLVGEWQTEITLKPAFVSGPPVVESWRTSTQLVLGGRFVEMIGTNDANGGSEHSLIWYDSNANQYVQWYFNSQGHTMTMTGTWDADSNTLKWETADKTKTGSWVLKENQRDFRHSILSADGKVVSEANGVSKRIAQGTLASTFKNSIGMEFVRVPKGKSWLGGGKDKLGTEMAMPIDFYLGKYEVTQEEWEKVMMENPSGFSRKGADADSVRDIPDADLMRFPVENVSWDQCQLFVAKLNKLEKQTGWIYRLPTATEWEYACRGGAMADKSDSAFDFYLTKPTNTLLLEHANFNNGLKRTTKVGLYEANALHLHDMHGNVWEWCDDETGARGGASSRAVSGGCGDSGIAHCLAAFRGSAPSFGQIRFRGLRLARVPSGTASPEVKTPAVAPFTDADVRRIAALPAEQQVEEVCKELMRRNPGFDGKFKHKIEDGVVTEFRIVTDQVTDIAPIRVFNALRVLECRGTHPNNGLLADLTPLKGMNLARLTRLDLSNTKVTDAGMIYFKDCKNLTELYVNGTQDGGSQLSDAGLAHFQDCKALTHLNLAFTKVSDVGLAHFKDCQNLTFLHLDHTQVGDAGLANFKDCKNLTSLNLQRTEVGDAGLANFKDCKNLSGLFVCESQVTAAGLVNFKGIPLKKVWIDNTDITDLTPLEGMPLEEIHLTPKNITKGLDILRDMKSLKTIGIAWDQSWPAAEFWKRYDKGEFGGAPFTDADTKRIAALPAEQQIEEVRKELMRRNPGFDGKIEHKVEGGVVTGLEFVADQVTDISPVRALTGLQALKCEGSAAGKKRLADLTPLVGMKLAELKCRHTQVSELSPLKGMKLTRLWCSNTRATDLTPLEGMPLTDLQFTGTQVSDLLPLQDMPLEVLTFNNTKVSNLSPLKGIKLRILHCDETSVADLSPLMGMPMTSLWFNGTKVTDLSMLKNMPLTDIRFDPKVNGSTEIVRALKTLKTINDKPPAEFWKEVEKR